MGRKIKPLIYIFCEGESEIEYAKCLKEAFSDVVVIEKPVKGLFVDAERRFEKETRYRNYAEVTDEIWFFFDVDHDQTGSWDKNRKTIQHLRKLRKRPNIKIRLLMTTGCVEYWYLLHYEKVRPSIQTVAQKEQVITKLKKYCPNYDKGDKASTGQIYKNMDQAVANGHWSLKNVPGLPTLEECDTRNQWLYQCSETFTTVQEAIEYLKSL